MAKPTEKFYNCNRVKLPEGFDPDNMDLKRKLHEKADEKNRIMLYKGQPVLSCGANKPSGGRCTSIAGHKTEHMGYGRCKYHGGNNTGPVTPEGKAKMAANSTLHGLYAKALLPDEVALFNDLLAGGSEALGLKMEILMLKAKILKYMVKWSDKWKAVSEKEGEDVADQKTKVWYRESEGNTSTSSYYHAATLEDKTLDRALNTLRRLCDTYAKMNTDDSDDVMQQVNSELRAASFGQVQISWGGKPQTRQEGGGTNGKPGTK